MNDTIWDDGLVPSRLVFDIIPQVSNFQLLSASTKKKPDEGIKESPSWDKLDYSQTQKSRIINKNHTTSC